MDRTERMESLRRRLERAYGMIVLQKGSYKEWQAVEDELVQAQILVMAFTEDALEKDAARRGVASSNPPGTK